jgi:glycosyltransferase involved in cell wall biosynthesis
VTDGALDRTALLVLGAHRSGTSAVTRVLNLLGADLPRRLLGPREDNPRGFWESTELIEIHEEILTTAGSVWDDWRPIDLAWYRSPAAADCGKRLRDWLGREFAGSRLFVIKDPRMCRLVRLWREVLDDFGARVKVIVPVRNPVEVAGSLKRRDGFPAAKSHLIWLRHVLDAVTACREVPTCVVSYGEFLRDWRQAAGRITRGLNLTWPDPVSGVEDQIADFLSERERHHVVADDGCFQDPEVHPWVKRAYRALLSMAADEDVEEAQDALAGLRQEVETALAALGAEAVGAGGGHQQAWVEREADRRKAWQAVRQYQDTLIAVQSEHAARLEQLFRDAQAREDDRLAAWRNVEGLNAALTHAREEIARLREGLAAAGDDRERAWTTARAHQDELATATAAHAARLDAFVREAQARDDDRGVAWRRVKQLESQLEESQQDWARIEEGLRRGALAAATAFDADRARLEERVRALEAAVAAERVNVVAAHREWRELRAGLQRAREFAEGQASDLTARLEAVEARAASADRAIDTVWRSRSWRFTQPLRDIAGRSRAAWERVGQLLDRLIRIQAQGPGSADSDAGPAVRPFPVDGIEGTHGAQGLERAVLPEPVAGAATEVQPVALTTRPPLDDPVVRLVAFFLPQFHPIPENDEWWGKGFTEWTKVVVGTPQFVGHYQPHLPGELGFYDLRVPEVQRRQVELARLYGVSAFCFYFYWFSGKRLLEAPILQYLRDPSLELPFCLCWANENWSRRWDGLEQDILIEQRYSDEDDVAFIAHVAQFFRDPRYVRIGGRPLLVVYRPERLPSARATAERWRGWCRANGIGEIYLANTQAFRSVDPAEYGFDAAIEFPPNNSDPSRISERVELLNDDFTGSVYDWETFVRRSRCYPRTLPYRLFRGVTPSWDNTPRRGGRGSVFAGSSPGGYREWLTNAALDTCARFTQPDERLVFVNGWNEWAEGAHLEPDVRYGYAYLQATRDALEGVAARLCERRVVIVSHDAYPHGSQYIALHMARGFRDDLRCVVDLVVLGDGPLKEEFARYATVHDLAGCDPEGPAAQRLAERLFASGARAAIGNTTVSGPFLETLKQAGFRCVALIHELPGVITGHRLQGHAARIAAAADLVVFPTRQTAEAFQAFGAVAEERTVIRPQGLYKTNARAAGERRPEARIALREKLGLPDTARIVLTVGYADARKGVDLFVEAGRLVMERDADAHFVWLGHHDVGLWPSIEVAVARTGFARRFHWAPRDPSTDLYYAGADVYALTSREDPFPTVVLEALDAGLPVVAFAGASGSCELLAAGCGLLVPAFEADAFAIAVCSLLDDVTLAHRLGETGQRRTRADFSFRRYVFDLARWLELPLRRVSVVVPSYNYAGFLAQRMQSIASQSYPIFEVIVLDDASTDGSAEWLRATLPSLGLDYALMVNERNSGSAVAQWKRGVDAAGGDLVWIAEADDVADDGFLAALIDSFERDASVVMAYCQSRQMAADGTILCEHYLDYTADISETKWRRAYVEDGIVEIRTALAVKNTVPNVSAVVFSRPALAAALRAAEEEAARYRVAGDWIVYLAALGHGRIAFTPRSLNSHRRHVAGVTLSRFDAGHLREVMEVQRLVKRRFRPPLGVLAIADTYARALFVQFGLGSAAHPTPEEHPELAPLCAEEDRGEPADGPAEIDDGSYIENRP